MKTVTNTGLEPDIEKEIEETAQAMMPTDLFESLISTGYDSLNIYGKGAVDGYRSQARKMIIGEESQRPEYIQCLINKGYLQDDGKTALRSIQKIADFLAKDLGIQITKDLLFTQFRKRNSDPFSERTCEDAVSIAMKANPKSR